jgi:hypothetical protein
MAEIVLILVAIALIAAMLAVAICAYTLGYWAGREAKVLRILDGKLVEAEGSDGNDEAASR